MNGVVGSQVIQAKAFFTVSEFVVSVSKGITAQTKYFGQVIWNLLTMIMQHEIHFERDIVSDYQMKHMGICIRL